MMTIGIPYTKSSPKMRWRFGNKYWEYAVAYIATKPMIYFLFESWVCLFSGVSIILSPSIKFTLATYEGAGPEYLHFASKII